MSGVRIPLRLFTEGGGYIATAGPLVNGHPWEADGRYSSGSVQIFSLPQATSGRAPAAWLTRQASRALDGEAERVLGIPSILLMENAGAALAAEARRLLEGDPSSGILLLCGPGNNGGDAFSAARRLLDGHRRVEALLLAPPDPSRAPDAARNREIFRRCGGKERPLASPEELRAALGEGRPLVVDAIYGTGLSRPLDPATREVVEVLNASGARVLAADIPTGLDADSGEILGAAVRAEATVTFAAPKRGFFRASGPAFVGRVVVADLGLPPSFIEGFLTSA